MTSLGCSMFVVFWLGLIMFLIMGTVISVIPEWVGYAMMALAGIGAIALTRGNHGR